MESEDMKESDGNEHEHMNNKKEDDEEIRDIHNAGIQMLKLLLLLLIIRN